MLGQSVYRFRQFWHAMRARPQQVELDLVRKLLKPEEYQLFLQMQPGEQAHSINVMKEAQCLEQHSQRSPNPDLLAAALLHDVGKARYPLQIWERVFIVLGKALLPRQAKRWGQGKPYGWRRAFVVAEQHPAWGAEMALRAGSSPQTVRLISNHQAVVGASGSALDDHDLRILQTADSES